MIEIRNRNFTNEEEDDGKGIISQKRNPIDSRREKWKRNNRVVLLMDSEG